MAEGIRTGFKELYDVNEYAHDLTKEKLSALITQLTGAEKDSRATRATVATFHNLKPFADFDKESVEKLLLFVKIRHQSLRRLCLRQFSRRRTWI